MSGTQKGVGPPLSGLRSLGDSGRAEAWALCELHALLGITPYSSVTLVGRPLAIGRPSQHLGGVGGFGLVSRALGWEPFSRESPWGSEISTL